MLLLDRPDVDGSEQLLGLMARLGIHACYCMVVVVVLVGAALTLVVADTGGLTAAAFVAWVAFMLAVGFYLGAYRIRTGRWFDQVV